MRLSLSLLSVLASLALIPRGATALSLNPTPFGSVRIEGVSGTIFEGPVFARPQSVTTLSGGTHMCDGTNNGANPVPGPTCTTALASAARQKSFSFDGTWDSTFEDFFITSISTTTQTATQFWGLLVNYQFSPVGGCQQQIAETDQVLWAFDAFNKSFFLQMSYDGPASVKVGSTVRFKVVDGSTGTIIPNAAVSVVGGGESGTSDNDGFVSITVTSTGKKTFKAERSDSLRSNGIVITVSK